MAANTIQPLPFRIYLLTVAVAALAGLSNSIYLAFSHYRVHTDILYSSFCAISQAMNCDTVSASPYSILLGVSVAAWGILGYVCFLLLLWFARFLEADRRRIWPTLFLIALGFSLYSVYLAYISKFYIHSYCIMCIAGYAINFFLLYFIWIIRRRFPEKGFFAGLTKDVRFLLTQRKKIAYLFSPLAVAVLMLVLFFPAYWRFELPPVTADVTTGVTDEGHPWIGAEDPKLVIIEFSDYMCFQCKKMHAHLRQIVRENPDTIRLVHRHFPMEYGFNPIVDAPFHRGASKLALAAAYAVHEDRFWQMNDYLYDIPRGTKTLDVRKIAEETGVTFKNLAAAPNSKRLRSKVKIDIYEGIELGITGTPAYVIGEEVFQGRIPMDIINTVIQ